MNLDTKIFGLLETPVVVNGKVQTNNTLRESIRQIDIAVDENHAESQNLAWVEAREVELDKLESEIYTGDKTEDAERLSGTFQFRRVLGDAQNILRIRRKDLKGDWGYDFQEIQRWKDMHFGEISRPGLAPMIAQFWYQYSRDSRGRWSQWYVRISGDGEPEYVDDFFGEGEDDEKFKDMVLRFQGRKACPCHGDNEQPQRHMLLYFPEYMSILPNHLQQ